jgi:glyoxylase-like metal-dependent hydrolase (beta-lactamase superfamily II)
MRLEKFISSGVHMMGRFKPCMCATFVLTNGGEAVILELPPGSSRKRPPWIGARRFIKRHKLNPVLMLASHTHWDHLGGFRYFRHTFPKTPFIINESGGRNFRLDYLDRTFPGRALELSIGGEPMFILSAPKHSYEDLLVVFKGTVCTGDWTLGPMQDCNAIVSIRQKIATLSFVRNFLEERGYHVHTTYSAHGNDIRRGIDFNGMLREMENYWSRWR